MSKTVTDGFLPLSSLRLLVPPLQLVSAALWEIVKQGAVMYYGLLEEFVTTVLETVPELLTYTERVQLVTGLRAKVVLELCRNEDFARPQAIQPHLSRINTYITNQDKETSNPEVKASVTNFLKLVHTLMDDQCQRDIFYQKIFPTVFGPKYDSALQALMRKFLSRLQKLLPVPNLEQTSLWLSLSPSILKECVDFMNQPVPLNTLLHHHKHHGHKVPQALSSSGDDGILSSLSYHLPKVDNEEGDAPVKSGSVRVSQDRQGHDLLGSGSKKGNEENFKVTSSELMRNVERNGQQHVDGVTEVASVGVILQPFDESESSDDDDMDKNWLHHLKTVIRTSAKTFKCLVCGRDFGSLSKLKRHGITSGGCFKNRASLSDSASQSSFFEKINVHPKPKTCIEDNNPRSETELSLLASATRHNPSNMSSSPNRERSNDDYSLVCPVCGKGFTYPKNFDKHQRICAVGSKRQAETDPPGSVQNTVVSSGAVQIPTITDAPADSQAVQACKSPLRCQECGQGFTYCKSYEKHQNKCSKRAPRRKKRANAKYFVINECNFRSAEGANGSNAETSSETKGRESSKSPICADHADDSQAKSRTIKCTMCEKNFSEIVLMKRHYSKAHKVRGSYPCPLCKRTFVRLCELVRHQQNKKLYQCAACKKCYTKPGLLNDHEKVHTASVPPCICETCGKSFKSLAYLILHQSKHRERQPSVCSYCGKHFSTKDCLRAHVVRHTGGYPCPVCGKKFYQKTYLKWHLYKHTGKEPYLCDTCGKGWPSAAQLKLHMIQHTEERPFKCEDCAACYKRGSHLMAHRRAKHIRLRPFACEVCSKAFRLNNELKKHMMVHTGERPYTCPRCGKTFTRKSRLREHREKACL